MRARECKRMAEGVSPTPGTAVAGFEFAMATLLQEAIRPSIAEHTQRFNRAVLEGLNQCYSAQNALEVMLSHLGKLRASGEFSDRDIGNIRAAVSDILRQVASNGAQARMKPLSERSGCG
jgi:hypothetical protein